MTSGGGMFSPEEIRYLKSLPAVAEVTAKRITYTDEFKRYCIRRYNEGASPVRLFRDAGLDPALIGYKRIERCIARWRAAQSRNMRADLAVLAKTPAGGGYPKLHRRARYRSLRSCQNRRRRSTLRTNPASISPLNGAPSSCHRPGRRSMILTCGTCSSRSRCVSSIRWSGRSICSRPCCTRSGETANPMTNLTARGTVAQPEPREPPDFLTCTKIGIAVTCGRAAGNQAVNRRGGA